jgi:hypothetical protein
MMGVRKHIYGSYVRDTIPRKSLGFFVAGFSDKHFEISSKGCWITGDIDDFFRSKSQE